MGPLQGEEPQLTNDLEASIVGLSQDYRVMVGWDPQLNQDVGWITVKQGVQFNFDNLQVRDFNLNIRGFGEDGGASQEYPSHSTTTTDTKLSVMHDKKDELKNSEKHLEKFPQEKVSELLLPLQKLHGPNTYLLSGSNVNKDLVTCSYCNRKVAYLPVHEKKCQVKNAKNQERVECPLCDFKPTLKGISTHLRSHYRHKRTCPFCNNVLSKEIYDSHLRRCGRCSFCGMSFKEEFSLLRHKELKHPGMRMKKPCSRLVDDEDEIKYAFTGNDEENNDIANIPDVVCDDKSEEIASTLKVKSGDLVGNEKENLYSNITSVDSNSNGYVAEDESSELASILKCTKGSTGYRKNGNNSEVDQCRLNFEFHGDETIKKSVKISMFEPVEKAMNKFCAYKKCVRLFGSKLEDLEFKSNGTLLTGEEYAGSIEDGLIKVNKMSDLDQDCRGGDFADGDERNSTNLHHFPRDQKKDLSLTRPFKALPISAHENFDHDEMEIDSTEVIVKFAQF